MTDDSSPAVAAVETVGGVLTDLVEVAGRLPVPPGEAEHIARILDRLSEEVAEAAQMIRAARATGPQFSPWAVVRLVTAELTRDGIKSRFGHEADRTAAAGHAARLLDALGVAPVVPDDSASAAVGTGPSLAS